MPWKGGTAHCRVGVGVIEKAGPASKGGGNPRIQEAEAGGSMQVQDHPGQQGELNTSMNDTGRHWLKRHRKGMERKERKKRKRWHSILGFGSC